MYISLLDYLEEIKKKFYVIILMIVLFLVISVGYKFYKNNNYELSFSKNLQSLSTLTLSNIDDEHKKIPPFANFPFLFAFKERTWLLDPNSTK